MQGRIGIGVFEARPWVAGAWLALALLVATASSSGADPDAQMPRGHAPKVKITAGPPSKTSNHHATFKFKSDRKKTKFKCKLDGGSYQRCSSPRKVSVGKGKHSFSVYGTSLGVPGPVDARKWTVTGKSATGARHHQLQNFVFDGGAGSPLNGIIVSADGPNGCALQYCQVNEPDLGGDGAVIGGGPYPDCPHGYHYHGFLFGQPDQPSGCGWGPVSELSVVAPGAVVQNASVAITLEEAALLSKKPKTARAQLSVATERLAAALQNPSIDMASAAALSQAEDLDAQADGQLQKAAALSGKKRAKKIKKAGRLIEDALALKRQVWDALVYQQ
jgi:hypothetical protein